MEIISIDKNGNEFKHKVNVIMKSRNDLRKWIDEVLTQDSLDCGKDIY
jgi:hypothetical protein